VRARVRNVIQSAGLIERVRVLAIEYFFSRNTQIKHPSPASAALAIPRNDPEV
jgi:hypothetical protein